MAANHYISPETLARHLGVTTRTITRWCRWGRIDGARQDGGYHASWRIPIEVLQAPSVSELAQVSEGRGSAVQVEE